jgi:hypothetical protein
MSRTISGQAATLAYIDIISVMAVVVLARSVAVADAAPTETPPPTAAH